jgi:hypothetical protein
LTLNKQYVNIPFITAADGSEKRMSEPYGIGEVAALTVIGASWRRRLAVVDNSAVRHVVPWVGWRGGNRPPRGQALSGGTDMAERTRRRVGGKPRTPSGPPVAALTHRLLDRVGDAYERLAKDCGATGSLLRRPAQPAVPALPLALVIGIPIVHSTGVAWPALISESLGLAIWICSCGAPLAGMALLLALSRWLTQAMDAAPRSIPVLASVASDREPARVRRVSRRPSPASMTADEVHRVHTGDRLNLAAALVRRLGVYDRFADAAA